LEGEVAWGCGGGRRKRLRGAGSGGFCADREGGEKTIVLQV